MTRRHLTLTGDCGEIICVLFGYLHDYKWAFMTGVKLLHDLINVVVGDPFGGHLTIRGSSSSHSLVPYAKSSETCGGKLLSFSLPSNINFLLYRTQISIFQSSFVSFGLLLTLFKYIAVYCEKWSFFSPSLLLLRSLSSSRSCRGSQYQ